VIGNWADENGRAETVQRRIFDWFFVSAERIVKTVIKFFLFFLTEREKLYYNFRINREEALDATNIGVFRK
jgi:hypothetical protein